MVLVHRAAPPRAPPAHARSQAAADAAAAGQGQRKEWRQGGYPAVPWDPCSVDPRCSAQGAPGPGGSGRAWGRGVRAAGHHPPRPPPLQGAGGLSAPGFQGSGSRIVEPSFVPGLAAGGSWKVPPCQLLTQVPVAFTFCIIDLEILGCKGQAQSLGEEATVASRGVPPPPTASVSPPAKWA